MQNRRTVSERPRAFTLAAAALLAVAACSAVAPVSPVVSPPIAAPAASVPISAGPRLPTPTLDLVTAMVGAPESGLTVDLIGYKFAWNVRTISVPAGQTWHVHFEMQDTTDLFRATHNLVIETGPAFEQRVFSTSQYALGTYEVTIPGLPAGTYTFLCTVHPETMTGTLFVEGVSVLRRVRHLGGQLRSLTGAFGSD